METFLTAHPDTVLVIIDTLQMVRPARDATYANDYRDLSALKRIADAHGIAILLIHHLRKETADDVFNRISGTTAISGAVDSGFTLVEEKRGSGRAKLSCVGRDIEYRELTLERNGENVWELVSDSRTQPELLGDRIVYLLSELMRDRSEFIGTPTELSERIDPVGVERMSPKKVSRQILQNLDALRKTRHFGCRCAVATEGGSLSCSVPKVTIPRVSQQSTLLTLLSLSTRLEERRGPGTRIPPFGRASRAFVRLCRTWPRRKPADSGQKPGPTASTVVPHHSLPAKAESSFITHCLLSKRDPLRWALVWWGRENGGMA